MIGKLLEIIVGVMVICFGAYLFDHADVGSSGTSIDTIVIRTLTVILILLGVFAILFALFPDRIQRFMYGDPNRRFF